MLRAERCCTSLLHVCVKFVGPFGCGTCMRVCQNLSNTLRVGHCMNYAVAQEVIIRVRSYQMVKEPSVMHLFQVSTKA